jgi:hypothetical protein
MTVQGRNPDGQAERPDVVNVVPFPGDWFGPVEDLVPIPTDGPEAESPAVRAQREWEELRDSGIPSPDADAISFWGEETYTRPAPEPEREAGRPAGRRRSNRRWAVLVAIAGAVAAIAVILLVGIGLAGAGGQRGRPGHAASRRSGTVLAAASKPLVGRAGARRSSSAELAADRQTEKQRRPVKRRRRGGKRHHNPVRAADRGATSGRGAAAQPTPSGVPDRGQTESSLSADMASTTPALSPSPSGQIAPPPNAGQTAP